MVFEARLLVHAANLRHRESEAGAWAHLHFAAANKRVLNIQPPVPWSVLVFAKHENIASAIPTIFYEAGQNRLRGHASLDREPSARLQRAGYGAEKAASAVAIQISEAVAEAVGSFELSRPGKVAHVGE